MKRILLIAAMCAVALSCTQEATLTLTADVPAVQFGPEGGVFNTILFTNGSEWTATCDDPAVTFTPTSGAYTTPMHIEVGENTEHRTKAIRIAVTSNLDSNTRSLYIVVTQECHPFVLCNDSVRTIGPEWAKVFFTVNSDKGWRFLRTLLDGQEVLLESFPAPSGWIDPKSSAEPNNVEVTLLIPDNTSGKTRKWEILLASKAAPTVEACRLTVIQNGV